MKTPLLLLSSLLALAATASAAPNTPAPTPPPAPAPSPPPGPPVCHASGDVLLTIHHTRASQPTSDISLYANGAWTFAETDEHRKVGRTASGCLVEDTLAKVTRELAAMPWQVKFLPLACDAVSAESATFTPHGKAAYTAEACSSQELDKVSHAALTDVEKILDAVSAPVTPPCCKK